ncbi:terminase small subunit [Ottowia thiooxydans]|uniref:terminase small subunit n=1 Tax=Ottowia thiooxydans TaxID=219182 RepID=UPI0004225D7F|nr:terminase small subunit [Ottowia thiooxydans]
METKPVASDSVPDELETSPSKVDWATIEHAYTTTTESAREIARAHGVTHSAVAKRAKKGKWNRPEKEKPVSREIEKLEPRQQKFVQQYLQEPNATKAAIKAGYSSKCAGEIGSENLKKPHIKEAIEAERDKTARKLNLSRERVMAEYTKLAFFDMRQAYHEGGELKLPHELDEDTAAAIVGFETVEEKSHGQKALPLAVRKVRWTDKLGALNSIMKAQGWNKDVGTSENPLVIRNFTATERAVRMSRALQSNPELMAALMVIASPKAVE